MTTTPRLRRWQGNLDRLSARTPLRVKMITALLALVIVALAIISVASLTVFRNYQIQRANQQVIDLYQREVVVLQSGHGVNLAVTTFGPYLIAIVPSGTSLAAQAANQPGLPPGTSLPGRADLQQLVQGPRRPPGQRRRGVRQRQLAGGGTSRSGTCHTTSRPVAERERHPDRRRGPG